MRAFFLLSVFLVGLLLSLSAATSNDAEMLLPSLAEMDTSVCNPGAGDRVESLKRLVDEGRLLRDKEEGSMLRVVSDFFYRHVRFIDDRRVWGRADYWASPAELLCKGDGDSEDVAIAQYFTLLQIGVPDDRMWLVYAKSHWTGPVIVLLYRTAEGGLEVLHYQGIWSLAHVEEGNILEPVYAFNIGQFWIVNKQWIFAPLHGTQSMEQWQRILRSMHII